LATIDETVELTSNPAPLVGDPKLKPTVPIDCPSEILKQPNTQPIHGPIGKNSRAENILLPPLVIALAE
jgi:hypothetical protein